MPMSQSFKSRLFPGLNEIADHFGTPFHIYDETGIRETGRKLIQAFTGVAGFREYFAVKALPNPQVMKIIYDLGFGFDCSSIAELVLSRSIGASGDDIMFTSNNTSQEEFLAALDRGGCILNLDDISLIDKLPTVPERICFRYNPGSQRVGNQIIGNPIEAKYGISQDQFLEAYRMMRDKGVRLFGLHTMLVSNELDYRYMVQTTQMLLNLVECAMQELDITFEFINIGGGLGIPYKPEEPEFNIVALGNEIIGLLNQFQERHSYTPHLFLESGRYVAGPHGVLVTRAINHKNTYRRYIGVDASMSALMRPGMYGAYHHIGIFGRDSNQETEIVDVVGSLCENNDKFAVQRELPQIQDKDLLIIHDTGAHGHAMGFNYNGRLRPKELLLRSDGSVELIRREETVDDYLVTLSFQANTFLPTDDRSK